MNTLFQEVTNHHIQKDGFRETRLLDPYWKLRPVVYTENMQLRSEFGFEQKQHTLLGQNFSWIK